MIASVCIPNMLMQIEQHNRDTCDVPLAVAGEPHEGGVIHAISELAHNQGVKVGMKQHQAIAVCPDIQFIPLTPSRYQSIVENVETALTQFSVLVEPAAYEASFPNGWYVDLKTEKFSQGLDTAITLASTLSNTGNSLSVSVGVANGKFPSQVAVVAAKKNRIFYIREGHEADFIAFFPIRLLPLNTDMARRLPLFGIKTVGRYAALPKNEIQRQFGKHGVWVHELANGHDPRPVKPYQKPSSIRLNHQVDEPITNRLVLNELLNNFSQQLAKQLNDTIQMGNRLSLNLHFDDGSTQERSITLRHPSADSTYFAQNLAYLLSEMQIKRGITDIAVWLNGISKPTVQQASLFDAYRPSQTDLNQILQQLQARYGEGCFVQATIDDAKGRIPEHRFRFNEAHHS